MLPRIDEAGHRLVREVLDNGEGLGRRGYLRQRHRAEVLLQVADECIAHALAKQDSTGDHRPADRPVGHGPQEQSDFGHRALRVGAHRYRIDIDDREPFARSRHLLGAEPGGHCLEGVAHGESLLSVQVRQRVCGRRYKYDGSRAAGLTMRRGCTAPGIMLPCFLQCSLASRSVR